MRRDCTHYRSRTFPNGESVSSCELDLAPDAPWRCPENCPAYEKRQVERVGWEGVHHADPEPADEPPNLEGAASVLSETEAILNMIGPRVSKQMESKRRKQERKEQRRARRRARGGRLRRIRLGPSVRTAALVLALGGIVFVAARPSVLEGVPVIGPKKTASTLPTGAGWDQDVWPVAQFVQRERGLNFKHPVTVKFLAQDAFALVASRDNRPSPKEEAAFRDQVASMRALGLVQGDFDTSDSREFINQDLLGFYRFDTKTVYVRGNKATPDVRVTLAHELTHALDDQYFGLKRSSTSSGAQEAFRALSEGNAVRVQNAYLETLASGEQLSYIQSQNEVRPEHPNAPEVFSDAFAFPYVFGPTFIQALIDHDGNDAVDKAFRLPPVSEAEIVAPSLYLAHRKPVEVAAPALAPGQVRIEKPDDFGEMAMFLVLGDRLDYGTAWSAISGWAGDASVSYRQGNQVCVAVATASRTPADADHLLSATQRWAAAVPGANVTRMGDTVELRSCDPGKNAPPHAKAQPSAFEVLAIRAAIVRELREHSHMPQPVAECTADGVIARIGPGPLVGINETGELPPNDPRGVQIRKTATQAATVCFGKPA
jgi:hypothetical protein